MIAQDFWHFRHKIAEFLKYYSISCLFKIIYDLFDFHVKWYTPVFYGGKMSVTVEDIVNSENTLFQTGVLFDSSFYKSRISESRYSEIVSHSSRTAGFVVEALLDLAKRVSTVAIIFFPSVEAIFFYGQTPAIAIIGAGLLCALMSAASDSIEKRAPHIFEVWLSKGDLFACLDMKGKAQYLLREPLLDVPLKFAYLFLIRRVHNTFFAYAALFNFGFSYGRELLTLAEAGIEEYFKRVKLPALEKQINSLTLQNP